MPGRMTRTKHDRPPLDCPAMPSPPPDATLVQAIGTPAPPQAPADPITPRSDPPTSGTGSKPRRSRPRQLALPFGDRPDEDSRRR